MGKARKPTFVGHVNAATGRIVGIDEGRGLGYLKLGAVKHPYAFTFDKIRRYGGETAKEIGLVEGSEIKVNVRKGLVTSVIAPKLERLRAK